MAEPWTPPTPRDELFARVVARGRHLVLVRRVVTGLVVAAVAGAGAVGAAIGAATGGSDVSLPTDRPAVTLFDCPGDGAGGRLLGGDRVFLTGRSADGDWVELRDPTNPAARQWLPASVVAADDDVAALDVVEDCGTVTELAVQLPDQPEAPVEGPDDEAEEDDAEETEEVDGTTTTTTAVVTPGPTQPGPGPTQPGPGPTQPGPTSPPTTQAPPPGPPPAPAPIISSVTVPEGMAREFPGQPGLCATPSRPESGVVRASGVQHATSVSYVARLSDSSVLDQRTMSPMGAVPNAWQAGIGPFPWTADHPTLTVTVTVTATGPGGSTTRTATFPLDSCPGFG